MKIDKYKKKTERQIYLERLLEEERSFLYRSILEEEYSNIQINNEIESVGGESSDDIKIVYIESGPTPTNYILNLWDFSTQSGITINNLNLSFDPSINVEINWGDGLVEQINSNTNYNHTFS